MEPSILYKANPRWEFAGLSFAFSSQTLVSLEDLPRNTWSRKLGIMETQQLAPKTKEMEKKLWEEVGVDEEG